MNTESNGLSEQTITRVQTVRREPLTPYDGRYAELIDNTVGRSEIEKLWQPKWYDGILIATADVARVTKITLGTMPYLFNIIQGVLVANWKTTLTAVVGAIAYIVKMIFGLDIPTEAITVSMLFLIGIFAKEWHFGSKQAQD